MLKRAIELVWPPKVKPWQPMRDWPNTEWQTNETPPRKVTMLGRALIDPDITVIQIEGEAGVHWMMDCSSLSDGKVVTLHKTYSDREMVYVEPVD